MSLQKWSDAIWLVKLADEPLLSEELATAWAEAQQAVPAPDLVLDLAGLTMCNSSNLTQFLRLRKWAHDHGARLRLAAVPDAIWAVFLTTGLDKVFDFMPDVPTALTGLQIETRRRPF